MDGIILLAKQPGLTSFTSLHQVKRAIKSTKVGHTGTLDAFAQGLLVVCTGRLTRLAGHITEFDKSYQAVIQFGQETDTLDYEGNVILKAPCPKLEELEKIIPTFIGEQLQVPPTYSAIHIEGKRASELARQGIQAEIPPRKITVFNAALKEYKLDEQGLVEYCLIDFSVSKGTYIRSLARDIGRRLGSAAHLEGLYRTKVGSFRIEDAAFYEELQPFTIDNCIKIASERKASLAIPKEPVKEKPKYDAAKDQIIYEHILEKVQQVTPDIATQCGFNVIHLTTAQAYADFMNGRPLKNRLFVEDLYAIANNTTNAVFEPQGNMAGLITKDETGKIRYKLVIN